MKGRNTSLLKNRYKFMLDYQEVIKPFTPTIRELCNIWNVNSTNSAFQILHQLMKMGLIKVRKKENRTQYYAIRLPAKENQ